MEPLVIFLWEGYLIAFGLKVRRVTVDPCVTTVILADDILKVFVLHRHSPAGESTPKQVEEAADIAGLTTECLERR